MFTTNILNTESGERGEKSSKISLREILLDFSPRLKTSPPAPSSPLPTHSSSPCPRTPTMSQFCQHAPYTPPLSHASPDSISVFLFLSPHPISPVLTLLSDAPPIRSVCLSSSACLPVYQLWSPELPPYSSSPTHPPNIYSFIKYKEK